MRKSTFVAPLLSSMIMTLTLAVGASTEVSELDVSQSPPSTTNAADADPVVGLEASKVPANETLRNILSGQYAQGGLFLKQFDVKEEGSLKDQIFDSILGPRRDRNAKPVAQVIKLVYGKQNENDKTQPYKISLIEQFYSVGLDCKLATPPGSMQKKDGPGHARKGIQLERLQSYDPVQELADEDLADKIKNRKTDVDELLAAIPTSFKAYLTLHPVSEKRFCQGAKASWQDCVDWDNNVNSDDQFLFIHEFYADGKPEDAMRQCHEAINEIYGVLKKGQTQRILISRWQDPSLRAPVLGNLTTAMSSGGLQISFNTPDADFTRSGFFQEIDREVTCSFNKPNDPLETPTMGEVKFDFNGRRAEPSATFLKTLGPITRLLTSKRGDAGQITQLNPEGDPQIEVQYFQYFTNGQTNLARGIEWGSVSEKTSSAKRESRTVLAPFPTYIDVLTFDRPAKVIYRTIFDFSLKKVFRQELTALNLPVLAEADSLATVLRSREWYDNYKNWLRNDGQTLIQKHGGELAQILECSSSK